MIQRMVTLLESQRYYPTYTRLIAGFEDAYTPMILNKLRMLREQALDIVSCQDSLYRRC